MLNANFTDFNAYVYIMPVYCSTAEPWAYTKHFFTRAEEFSILINLLIGSIQKLKIPFTSLLLHQFWILIKQF